MENLLDKYKVSLDNQMKIEIGTAARTLEKGLPQGLLSNLTADVLKQKAEEVWGQADFAVVNIGGIRSTLNKGPISLGNIYEIYSFDNTLVLLELPAEAVEDFFQFIASNRGEGLSEGIQLVVKNKEIASLKIGGQAIDKSKTYKVATLDYLAGGKDGMVALLEATEIKDSGITLRDIMIEYVKKQTANHKEIDATLDDRIIITD
jgi:5''-nucleotidase/2'',3''-cyclic phosphodiesterase and related esterases